MNDGLVELGMEETEVEDEDEIPDNVVDHPSKAQGASKKAAAKPPPKDDDGRRRGAAGSSISRTPGTSWRT